MDPNRLTEKAQDAMRQAQSMAQREGQTQIEPEHLAVALLEQDGGVACSRRGEGRRQRGDARAAAAAGASADCHASRGRAPSGAGLPLASGERGPDHTPRPKPSA